MRSPTEVSIPHRRVFLIKIAPFCFATETYFQPYSYVRPKTMFTLDVTLVEEGGKMKKMKQTHKIRLKLAIIRVD